MATTCARACAERKARPEWGRKKRVSEEVEPTRQAGNRSGRGWVGLPCRRGALWGAGVRPVQSSRRGRGAAGVRRPPGSELLCCGPWKTWRHVKNFPFFFAALFLLLYLLLVGFFHDNYLFFVLYTRPKIINYRTKSVTYRKLQSFNLQTFADHVNM